MARTGINQVVNDLDCTYHSRGDDLVDTLRFSDSSHPVVTDFALGLQLF